MNRPRSAFTLVELLASVALAMLLVALAMGGFYTIRRNAARQAMRIEMADRMQNFYMHAFRDATAMEHHGAMLIENDAGTGRLRLLFLKAREHPSEYYTTSTQASNINPELTWHLWEYSRTAKRLWASTNTVQWTTKGPQTTTVAGVWYNNAMFHNQVQPRRFLATDWSRNLNDNVYFPDTLDVTNTAWVKSVAPEEDRGDWTDLQRNLRPILDDLADLSIVIVANDGTETPIDPAITKTRFWDGVTVDGVLRPSIWRSAFDYQAGDFVQNGGRFYRCTTAGTSAGAGGPAGAGTGITDGSCTWAYDAALPFLQSTVAKRPALLRLRLTMSRMIDGAPFERTYSFSLPTSSLSTP